MDKLARLKWQCRRGTKELDFLLLRYLESGYLPANKAEQALFVELLGLEDDVLVGVLMGNLVIKGMEDLVIKGMEDLVIKGMEDLVGKIRASVEDMA